MKASDQIQVWKLFLDLRNSGSIRKTAEQYGHDSAEISRTLSKLEKELKVPLLDRRSRPFRLTEMGEEIFPLVEDMLGRFEEILEKIEQKANKESAVIRIMVPNTFVSISHSLFFEYIKFFPKHKIRVITPVNTEEFRKGSADIVAVTGNVTLPDTVLIPRGRMIFVPVAAPSFIEKYGLLNHPDRLAEVPVGHTFGGDKFSHTPFDSVCKQGKRSRLHLCQQIEWSSPNLLFESVLAGECASPGMPLFYCIDALRTGKLVPILDGWHRASQFNYLACHSSRWNVPYIRTFMSWFAERFAAKEAQYEKEFAELFGEELLHELMSS